MAGESPFPLNWPAGWPRAVSRRASPFRTKAGKERLSISGAIRRLMPELDRLGARDVIVSCNVRPHLYDQAGVVSDPGAAAYFFVDGAPTVLACDKWDRVADNVAAIAAHVEALRGQERWGVGSRAQAFAGYKALPAMPAARPWWEVLGLSPTATADQIAARRRELLERLHPDRPGGDASQAADVNAAYQAAMGAR
jgi:hypothetical protein